MLQPTMISSRALRLDEERAAAITRENAHLLDRLARVATRRGPPPGVSGTSGPRPSSFSINRRKQQQEIEKANLSLLRRLHTTRPTLRTVTGGTAATTARARPALPPPRLAADSSSARGADDEGFAKPGRPAWQDPTAKGRITTTAEYESARARPPAAASGAGAATRLGSAKASVFGRASVGGGTLRVPGSGSTGVPPSRGARGEVDVRDLALAACPEKHLT